MKVTADQSSHTSGKGDFNVKIECTIQLNMIGIIEYLVLKRMWYLIKKEIMYIYLGKMKICNILILTSYCSYGKL